MNSTYQPILACLVLLIILINPNRIDLGNDVFEFSQLHLARKKDWVTFQESLFTRTSVVDRRTKTAPPSHP
jgi:hypothetical protein